MAKTNEAFAKNVDGELKLFPKDLDTSGLVVVLTVRGKKGLLGGPERPRKQKSALC
jgi:hypothetical protein